MHDSYIPDYVLPTRRLQLYSIGVYIIIRITQHKYYICILDNVLVTVQNKNIMNYLLIRQLISLSA